MAVPGHAFLIPTTSPFLPIPANPFSTPRIYPTHHPMPPYTTTSTYHHAHYHENPHYAPPPHLYGSDTTYPSTTLPCHPCDRPTCCHTPYEYTFRPSSHAKAKSCCSSSVKWHPPCPPTFVPRLHQPCIAVLCAPPVPSYTPDCKRFQARAIAKGCGDCRRCVLNSECAFYCGVSGEERTKGVWGCDGAFVPRMHVM